MKLNKQDLIFAVLAVLIGVLTRTVFDLGHNIEMVTGFAIVCGYFFRNKKFAYVVPLVTMILSDLFIKNTNIFVFTWSGFLFGPLLGSYLRKLVDNFNSKFSIGLVGSQLAGVVSTLIFFFWTNFGVWLVGNMYSKDLSGLLYSYLNGIPFLNNQISGNLIIVPIVFVIGSIYYSFNMLEKPIIHKNIV